MTKFRFLFERDEFWHPAAGVGIKFTLVVKDVVQATFISYFQLSTI